MLCYVMLCYVMLCYVMLCYVMLCYVMLCYVMLCYVMLCYVMLYNTYIYDITNLTQFIHGRTHKCTNLNSYDPSAKIVQNEMMQRQIYR